MNQPQDRLFRAILIDPEHRSVNVIVTNGSVASMHALIGAETLDSFRLAEHDDSFDYAWVDDGGLQRGEPIHAFLLPAISKDPKAGRCLVVGADRDGGETTDAKFPLDILHGEIAWLGLIKPEVTWDHTERGSRAIVIYERVKAC